MCSHVAERAGADHIDVPAKQRPMVLSLPPANLTVFNRYHINSALL
jgi:hypothetical protein